MSSTFILVSPPGPATERLQSHLQGVPHLRVVPGVERLRELLEGERDAGADALNTIPGEEKRTWILAGPSLPAVERDALLELAKEGRSGWRLLVVEEVGGAFHARPISVGYAEPLEPALERAAAPEAEGPVLELREVLQQVSRARHDLNNPLTAAMAEVQLLLMDAEEGTELRESLDVVRSQLERIRDLVADLRTLRAPRSEGEAG